jgi:hypothetical protein
MSDETETEKEPKGAKRPQKGDTFEGAQVEPVPKRPDFFAWLESLFDGSSEFPEKLDVRVVKGKDFATMGPMVMQKLYSPAKLKPTKEELVKLSNEVLHRVQVDCDQQRKSVVYHVAAIHFSRNPEPYERWLIRANPGKTYKNGEDGEAEDGDDSQEDRFSAQLMRHQEQMFGLSGASMEGIFDRQDRIIERLLARGEAMEDRLAKTLDMLERALDRKAEREESLAWTKLKVEASKQGLGLAMQLAPPLLNGLVGKNVVPTSETLETITLKNFLKPAKDGGQLTEEQSAAAFGLWDDTPEHNLVKPGILRPEQSEILYRVAFGQLPPDELDKLIPGAGALAVTMEQLAALQQVFAMEQLAPLLVLFEGRQKRAKQ